MTETEQGSYWLKRKGDSPVLVSNTPEDPQAVSRYLCMGYRQCDGPEATEDADCGCGGAEIEETEE